MQGHSLHVPRSNLLHEDVSPVVVVCVGAAGYLVEVVSAVVAAVGRIPAVQVGVVFRAHASAAAPAFVAYAEVFQFPGLLPAVALAQLRHGGNAVKGHVLHPVGKLLNGAAADVSGDVRLAADKLAEIHEFMRAETVVLDNSAPVGVYHLFALGHFADSVAPVVFIGEAAAGPAQHGELYLPESVHDVLAVAVDVRNIAVLADVYPVVNAAPEVLGEVAVDLAVDVGFLLQGI